MNKDMKKILFSLIGLWLSIAAIAQTDFRHITFSEAKAAAKAEGKLMFIDFYTEWCGPCKRMAAAVFPQKKVGDFINPKFVCIKIDAEKGEGKDLAKTYKVTAYPTFIITDADGTEKGRFLGMMDEEKLIIEIERISDPNKSPERIKQRYAEGERTAELVSAYAAIIVDDAMETRSQSKIIAAKEKADSLVQAYFKALSDDERVKQENMFVYRKHTFNPNDASTQFILKNLSKFPESMRHDIDSISRFVFDYAIYRWIGDERKLDKAEYDYVKATVKKMGYNKDKHFDAAYAFIEEYAKGDKLAFIDFCAANFTKLDNMQKIYLTQNYADRFADESYDTKKKAARFLRNQLPDMELDNMYFTMIQIRDLEKSKH